LFVLPPIPAIVGNHSVVQNVFLYANAHGILLSLALFTFLVSIAPDCLVSNT